MSDAKISALPSAATLTGAERLPVSQSNQTRGATAQQIKTFALQNMAVNVKDSPYNAVGDGVTDDTAAIQAAFAASRTVLIPAGTYKITSQLLTPSGNGARIVQEGNISSVILKAFNGDAVSLRTGELVWENCCIQGQGATYTGGGINVPTGGGFSSKLLNPRITDTADSCIIFVADSGSGFATEGISVLQPTNNATPAIRNSGVDAGPTTRMFCNLYGGFTAIDFTGMETTQVLGGTANAIVYGDNSKKASVIGMRLTTAGVTISIKGTDHFFGGNIVAGSVDLTATASNPTLGPCVFAAGFRFLNSGGIAYNAYNALNGVQITGPAALGATGVQTFSFETPVTRFYVGDGTGYSFAFSKRIGSVTTDQATLTDAGIFSLANKFYPAQDTGAIQTASALYAGTGVPNNANGANGDFYFRGDGTQAGNTVIYHKQGGAWVALITT